MKAFLLFVSSLLLSASLMASDKNYSTEVVIDSSVEVLSATELIQSIVEEKNASCYAYTRCYNGLTIQCQTWGQGCTFYGRYGQFVQCTGYNARGQWVTAYASCY